VQGHHTRAFIGQGHRREGLYIMNHLHLPFSPATGFAAANVPWYTHIPPPFVSDIWHHHLGHLSTDRL